MDLNKIVQRVNAYLAGETLPYSELVIHLDSVIDDINHELNSVFPAFSEFENTHPDYPNYKFFPDRYIRNVVCLGAAFKFFLTDEEGAEVATRYDVEYQKALFLMQRDYSHKVPLEFQATEQGYLVGPDKHISYDEHPINPTHYLSGEPFHPEIQEVEEGEED